MNDPEASLMPALSSAQGQHATPPAKEETIVGCPPIRKVQAAAPKIQFRGSDVTRVLIFVIVWLLCIGYMWSHLKVGWVPHDEGTLGLSAERVLQGQLPHRDFDDYTGGLTLVHALAFRIFGINSVSMRYVLFAFFVPWVPAVFYVASRFGTPIWAGAVTLLAVAWSVPNYPGPMPSWYNLFFATWGIAALFRYLKHKSWRWLFLAGLCGGLSMLAKVTGAYFIAAVFLFFVFREQSISSEQKGGGDRGWSYSATVIAGLLAFLVLLYRMIHGIPGFDRLFFFVFPVVVLSAYLIAREVSGIPGTSRERFQSLLSMCAPFLAAVVLMWMVFLIPFLPAGALHDLARGLVAVPMRAMQHATYEPPSPMACVSMIPFVLPVMLAYDLRGVSRTVCAVVLAIFAGATLAFSTQHSVIYGLAWSSVATAIPILTVAGVAVLWATRKRAGASERQQQVMLLLCSAAICGLVQFPFGASVYFMYVAPLVFLAAQGLCEYVARPPRLVLGVLAAFYLSFALYAITSYHLGLAHEPNPRMVRLALSRAGDLHVEASDSQIYQDLIQRVKDHAGGEFIYAAPDCPEVYFLSGLHSFSPHYFEYTEVKAEHTNWVLERLEQFRINLVAIKKDPRFSGAIASDLRNQLEKRYPHSEEIGDFTLMWRELP